jgi:hypothetical protein
MQRISFSLKFHTIRDMLTDPEKARMQSRMQLPAFLIGYIVTRGFLLVYSKVLFHRPPPGNIVNSSNWYDN